MVRLYLSYHHLRASVSDHCEIENQCSILILLLTWAPRAHQPRWHRWRYWKIIFIQIFFTLLNYIFHFKFNQNHTHLDIRFRTHPLQLCTSVSIGIVAQKKKIYVVFVQNFTKIFHTYRKTCTWIGMLPILEFSSKISLFKLIFHTSSEPPALPLRAESTH